MCPEKTCETLAPAGLFGRLGKMLMGIAQVAFVFTLVTNLQFITADGPPRSLSFWLVVVLAFYLFNWAVNLGFNRTWGKNPLRVAMAATAVAGLVGFLVQGQLWSAPLAAVVSLVAGYVHGHVGVCHILAAIMGTPGCEMRVFSDIACRFTGKTPKLARCPGIWSRIDEMEAAWRAKRIATN